MSAGDLALRIAPPFRHLFGGVTFRALSHVNNVIVTHAGKRARKVTNCLSCSNSGCNQPLPANRGAEFDTRRNDAGVGGSPTAFPLQCLLRSSGSSYSLRPFPDAVFHSST